MGDELRSFNEKRVATEVAAGTRVRNGRVAWLSGSGNDKAPHEGGSPGPAPAAERGVLVQTRGMAREQIPSGLHRAASPCPHPVVLKGSGHPWSPCASHPGPAAPAGPADSSIAKETMPPARRGSPWAKRQEPWAAASCCSTCPATHASASEN